MIVAPHPDDDVLATSGLIQRVLADGGEVFVVFVTDGDNNPWPQRAMFRKIFVGPEELAAWGAIRRREALCSLDRFGAGRITTEFFSLPDSRIARMARSGDDRLTKAIREAAARFHPTLIVSPSSFDLHADHRAVSWFVHRALPEASIVTYIVHGRPPAGRIAFRIVLTDREQARKRDAIECHASQLLLSRRRFLGYAREKESFFLAEHDLVRIDSRFRERIADLRHALLAIRGGDPPPEPSGIESAADVEDRPGDVAGLF